MKLFIQSTTRLGTFFRAGRMFTKAGGVFDAADFTEKQLEAIRLEPNLHAREATAEEIAAAAPVAAIVDTAHVIDALLAAIPQLPDDAFGKTGVADLVKLRAAAGIDPALVTAEARDTAMAKLVEGGFKAPLKA